MTKAELKLLENIFAREIQGYFLQSKDKRYTDLGKRGYVAKTKITLHGRFPVEIEGWVLTSRGHITYCQSCSDKPNLKGANNYEKI